MSLLIIAYYLVLQAIDKRHHEKTRGFLTECCGRLALKPRIVEKVRFGFRRPPGCDEGSVMRG